MTALGDRLKKARKAMHLTQRQLSDVLGLEQSAISNYETNFRVPSAFALREISNVLQVSLDFLLGTDQYKTNSPLPSETLFQEKSVQPSNQDKLNISDLQQPFLALLKKGLEGGGALCSKGKYILLILLIVAEYFKGMVSIFSSVCLYEFSR